MFLFKFSQNKEQFVLDKVLNKIYKKKKIHRTIKLISRTISQNLFPVQGILDSPSSMLNIEWEIVFSLLNINFVDKDNLK